MIAQTNHGIAKISPNIYGDSNRHIICFEDSKKFKLGCFIGTKTETLNKVGKKYGKGSEYYNAILNFEKLKFNPKDYTEINLYNSNITSIDVRNNTELTYLDLENNNLTSIDVSKNTQLKRLDLGKNNLTILDVSNNTKLKGLDIENNSSLKEVKIKKGQKIVIYKDKHTKIIEVE